MESEELKDILNRVKSKIRVTKVVATRSVKTGRGDFFSGMSAAWDTTQDDAGGPGADLELTMSDAEQMAQGMTLVESRVARYIIAMEADIGAYEAAFANGALSEAKLQEAVRALKNNYAMLIRNLFSKKD